MDLKLKKQMDLERIAAKATAQYLAIKKLDAYDYRDFTYTDTHRTFLKVKELLCCIPFAAQKFPELQGIDRLEIGNTFLISLLGKNEFTAKFMP
jgi:hypothetical protein